MSDQIDVFGVGNAMVDILALVDEDFVREHALTKGSMTLVDAEKQGALLQDLEHRSLEMQSGGSAANTIIGVAQSGGTGFYTGKIARDPNGEFYRQDLLESGVHFDVHPAPETGPPTGSCLGADHTRCRTNHVHAPRRIDAAVSPGCRRRSAEAMSVRVYRGIPCGTRPNRVRPAWRSCSRRSATE